MKSLLKTPQHSSLFSFHHFMMYSIFMLFISHANCVILHTSILWCLVTQDVVPQWAPVHRPLFTYSLIFFLHSVPPSLLPILPIIPPSPCCLHKHILLNRCISLLFSVNSASLYLFDSRISPSLLSHTLLMDHYH